MFEPCYSFKCVCGCTQVIRVEKICCSRETACELICHKGADGHFTVREIPGTDLPALMTVLPEEHEPVYICANCRSPIDTNNADEKLFPTQVGLVEV